MSNLDYLEELKQIPISFTDVKVIPDSGTRLDWKFEVNPNEYISFAKRDFREGSKRGLINSLGNSKRAIDCQIDRIFRAMGYDPKKYPKNLNEFSEFFGDEDTANLPAKLKVIVGFGIAPCGLVSEIRTLRNKIEHDFIVPSSTEVQRAFETAELFVAATERKLIDYWEFEIECKSSKYGFYLHRSYQEPEFECWIRSPVPGAERHIIKIPLDSLLHHCILRMTLAMEQELEFSRSLAYLSKLLDKPFQLESAKLEFSYE
ncbi:hypothetical protein HYO48_22190 [Vibrio parahaemolyticus]|nr:hypothetical protein [Vibrio parahaemolyticus]ELX7527543.1 hypothetical protein [Vibrio parahaemolyticus]MBM4864729.1 hypothetical protein [Vibrio parahaemolyticus]